MKKKGSKKIKPPQTHSAKAVEDGRPDTLILAYNMYNRRNEIYGTEHGVVSKILNNTNIHPNNWYPWEKGVRIPHNSNLEKIAAILRTTTHELMKKPENWDVVKWDFYGSLYPEEMAQRFPEEYKAIRDNKLHPPNESTAPAGSQTVEGLLHKANQVLSRVGQGGIIENKRQVRVLAELMGNVITASLSLPPDKFSSVIEELNHRIRGELEIQP